MSVLVRLIVTTPYWSRRPAEEPGLRALFWSNRIGLFGLVIDPKHCGQQEEGFTPGANGPADAEADHAPVDATQRRAGRFRAGACHHDLGGVAQAALRAA